MVEEGGAFDNPADQNTILLSSPLPHSLQAVSIPRQEKMKLDSLHVMMSVVHSSLYLALEPDQARSPW
jgi:hypothetical protein